MFATLVGAPALLGLLLTSSPQAPGKEQSPSVLTLASRREGFGTVTAPPAMPGGSASIYGFVGAPEVGVGYRQGISPLELEVRGRFNYLLLSFGADVVVKYLAMVEDGVELAPTLGLGLTYSTGSRYFDDRNVDFLAIRLEPGLVASFRVHDIVRVLGLLQVPVDIGVSPAQNFHTQALVGAGAEVYLDDDLSVLGSAQLGPDFLREKLGVPQAQLGFLVRLGIGYRLF